MHIDLGGPGELESVNAVDQLLRHYDRVTGTWSLKASGRFWEAVKIAHHANRTGRGVSIAVLDGWFDATLPHLRNRIQSHQVCSGAAQTAMDHGTAVALLIGAVAPDVNLDFYAVCDGSGRPQPGPVTHALELAAKSPVSIINLSAGRPRSWADTLDLHHHPPRAFGPLSADEKNGRPEDCLWCRPAEHAASRGKVIVSAVGNDVNHVFCPARSHHVVAVGFYIARRHLKPVEDGLPYEIGVSDQPIGYSQSSEVAFAVEQPVDAIGSSFGAPLFSGALALGVPGKEIPEWLEAQFFGSQAQYLLSTGDSTRSKVLALLKRAWSKAPHNHYAEPDPEPCFECSLFLEPLCTAESLHWLLSGAYDTARKRLEVNQRIMPWSPHAFVNVGNLLERVVSEAPGRPDARDLIAEAIRQYEIALTCTPPSDIAADRLADLRRAL